MDAQTAQRPISETPDVELDSLGASGPSTAVTSTTDMIATHGDPEGSNDGEREVRPLPPVDRGRAAWSFLAAATVVEMIVWGIPYSVGILHSYASTHLFPEQESTVTLAATLHNGLLFVGAGFFGP